MTDELRTERLLLTPLTLDDVDDYFRVYGDPRTWEHHPSGRHTDRGQSARAIERPSRAAAQPASGTAPWCCARRWVHSRRGPSSGARVRLHCPSTRGTSDTGSRPRRGGTDSRPRRRGRRSLQAVIALG